MSAFRRSFAAAVALTASLAAFPVAQAVADPGDATYEVTFDVSWSAATHPVMFPSNAHFSGLVGGTHSPAVQFWTPGTLASLGIKRMAEWGQQTTLAGEVQAAIGAGTAAACSWDRPSPRCQARPRCSSRPRLRIRW